MCHIVLFLPILALSLFFFLPFGAALPVYLVITAASAFVYFALVSAMKMKIQTGREGMIGREAVVVEDINPEGRVVIAGEIWAAAAQGEKFRKGERVKICAVEGMELIVAEPDEAKMV